MLHWFFVSGDAHHTLRAALAGIVAFGACLLLGPRVIRWLRAKKVGERIEKDDSKKLDALMQGKSGTPTMGGVFIVMAILLSVSLFADFTNPVIWVLVFTLIALGALGAYDDYLKLSGKRKGGMRMKTKFLLQMAISVAVGMILHMALVRTDGHLASRLYVPFCGSVNLGHLLYPWFVMMVIVATTNAVNITDGLDGLAGGCLGISTFAYTVIAYVVSRVDYSKYLGLPYVSGSAEVTVFCAAMLGATLGFLWFNSHPAQVFMGDSGSLPLGGALGVIACATKQEMLLFLVGGVFVIEAGSSLLQILSFKTTGRRIFSIAPLHHHYQFQGLPESKITLRFWIVAAVLAVSSLALLKVR
ncbi:MAG TPA: phospho-N-acetylmuramoyl-pentapeptide-transferase [Planctomycetota bacterium]|jgi:phospho-N-acetylmuramoyl-pentapeptide-transferase|nr:phospho-N-acetylmuramoyl-pentapeptide-transferase [Planctomycetota bacterium]